MGSPTVGGVKKASPDPSKEGRKAAEHGRGGTCRGLIMAVPSRLLLSEMEISDWCRNCNRRKALFDIVGLLLKILVKALNVWS